MDQCSGTGEYCKIRYSQFFYQCQPHDKTRHALQVTAASIHTVLLRAYAEHKSEETDILSLEKWCELRAQQSVHFHYWLKTLALETLMLLYVR